MRQIAVVATATRPDYDCILKESGPCNVRENVLCGLSFSTNFNPSWGIGISAVLAFFYSLLSAQVL